ncbi:hypothetical protein HK405_012858 [Cladochytrium tenue]|nr:hypothetical protein HK405_012858 [Cladochytrium tenue]
MTSLRVTLVGATGETGSSILDGLLESQNPKFLVTALVRPASATKPAVEALTARGVAVVPVELTGPQDALVAALSGQDIVVSAITATSIADQIPLVDAAKRANVQRFVPCDFSSVVPPKLMALHAAKEDVQAYILQNYVPYTFIDVGWWYQLSLPKLPSGRTDYALITGAGFAGDGTARSGLTDARDVGRWVARIVADPRTMNKAVFAYDEVRTQKEIWELVERIAEETPLQNQISETEIKRRIELGKTSKDPKAINDRYRMEYLWSWGIRGDNSPEAAKYLGYLDAWDLYPDFKPRSLEAYVQEVVAGKARPAYENNAALRQAIKGG